MSEELLTLSMLIVSENSSEREIVRRAGMQASLPIEITEAGPPADRSAATELLSGKAYDIVLFDSRIPKVDRHMLLEVIRAAAIRPLAILIGAAEMKSRRVITDGLEIDGTLAKPIDAAEAVELLNNCCRARLPYRALIVDDSSTVRSVIRKVLQASCYNLDVTEAGEGETALARAKADRFDIVFLDCHMPGLDGFATLDQLKRLQPNARTVMISGARDVRIEDRALAEGAVDFLYKPFFARDIDAVLNRLFGLVRAR